MHFGTSEFDTGRSGATGPGAVRPTTARSLVIVWHSMTGASRQLAAAVARGAAKARDPESTCVVTTTLVHARNARIEQLLEASAYVFVAPENLGSMSGIMKAFFDRAYYPLLGRIEGRAFAMIVAAGSDGTGAVRQIGRICTGWRLREAMPPSIVLVHAQTTEAILAPKRVAAADLARAAELGEALAEGVALGIY